MSSHQLSVFTQDHLDQATELSQHEHWPHRREDWEMLLKVSTGSVALRGDKVVGTALRTDYGNDVSAANMIIVAQSERGRGLGRTLMQAIMGDEGGRELRLVATQEGLPLYEKLGFVPEGEITQCQGNISNLDQPKSHVFSVQPGDIDEIIALDSRYFAADRGRLLHWLVQNATLATTRSEDGTITGYAALRRFGRGQVIGPIFAPSAGQAKDLIRHFAASRSGDFIRIDTDNALGLEPWLESIGLQRAGGGVKMRKFARTDPHPAYGFCSQALG